MTPRPWARTGPGAATDGRARFDLTTFDDGFFDHSAVESQPKAIAASTLAFMLFEGMGAPLESGADHVKGHPSSIQNSPIGLEGAEMGPLNRMANWGHRRRQALRGMMWWSMVVIHTAKSVEVEMASAGMNRRLARR